MQILIHAIYYRFYLQTTMLKIHCTAKNCEHVSKGNTYNQAINAANNHHFSHKDPHTIHVPTAIFESYLQAQNLAKRQHQAIAPLQRSGQTKTNETAKNKDPPSQKPNNKERIWSKQQKAPRPPADPQPSLAIQPKRPEIKMLKVVKSNKGRTVITKLPRQNISGSKPKRKIYNYFNPLPNYRANQNRN